MDINANASQARRVEALRSHIVMSPVSATSQKTIDRVLLHPPKTACLAEYDYIVVGGGSAGCALAARLAEKLPLKSILLVDAGADESKQFRVQSPFITCGGL
jgi:hypothetical protein